MKKFIFSAAMMILLISCTKDSPSADPAVDYSMDDLAVNSDFDYETSKVISVSLQFNDMNDDPVPYLKFDVISVHSSLDSVVVFSGLSNDAGSFSGSFSCPAFLDTVIVRTNYIGMLSDAKVALTSNTLNYVFEPAVRAKNEIINNAKIVLDPNFSYLGAITMTDGFPQYSEYISGAVSASLLEAINASLPETKPVPTYHPQYLENDNETGIVLSEEADVWITFVHEGAGHLNTIGFFTYDPDSPPQTRAEIDKLTIVFPNLSMINSGGSLLSGDRVKLGTFPAGTAIGWFLIDRGWSQFLRHGYFTNGTYTVYSLPQLNPETDPLLQIHSISLDFEAEDKILVGIEDLRRDYGSDDDFNDAVFYATSNPPEAIIRDGYEKTDIKKDTDGDGVSDQFDDYPNDPKKAYDYFYPGEGIFGTLAFEDNWPSKGDYDLNDIVIKYNFKEIANSLNLIAEVEASIIPVASGASYQNGYGFVFDQPSIVKSVTGNSITDTYLSITGDNVENGTGAIIAFDNIFTHYQIYPAGSQFINTIEEQPYIENDTLKLVIELKEPILPAGLGRPPYNSFIIANRSRGFEIHLPDQSPTSLMNTELFGTYDDDSDPASGRYFKSYNNLPWAINFPYQWDYPSEKSEIIDAYPYFKNWAESDGASFDDWYLNIENYKIETYIYNKP